MNQSVLYFHFGAQCPGTYMGRQAAKAAELLGFDFQAIDISGQPTLAEQYNLFFPGTIMIGDLKLVYPGTPEQIAASYHSGQPIPGSHNYQQLPCGVVEETRVLSPKTAGDAFRCCIPNLGDEEASGACRWLASTATDSFAGLIGYRQGKVVGYVEVLPETAIPYPIGVKRVDRAFVTCLYSPLEWGLAADYRVSLMQQLLTVLPNHGYVGVSIISGLETPYPNGPEAVLSQLGFRRDRRMGQALLRHKYEEAWLMRLEL